HAEQVQTSTIKVDNNGTAVYELGGLGPGVYRVEGKATLPGRPLDASDICLVRENGTELDRPVGDRATLEAIASATGGRALGAVDEPPKSLAFDPPPVVGVARPT